MAITFAASWDYGLFSLWGYLCSARASSDNEVRNEIIQLHADAKAGLAKVAVYPKTSERGVLKLGWTRRLAALEKNPLEYGEGLAVRDELDAMRDDIDASIVTEASEARERAQAMRKDGKDSKSASKPERREPARDPGDLADDTAFAAGYARTAGINGGPSKVTTRSKTKLTASPPLPTVSPQQRWKQQQRDMEAQCAQVASTVQPGSRGNPGYGAHPVTQDAVLERLPDIDGAQWLQGRPDAAGGEVRVMVAVHRGRVVCTLWTNGLSHDASRRDNTYVVYEQDGAKAKFARFSEAKHPQDPNP